MRLIKRTMRVQFTNIHLIKTELNNGAKKTKRHTKRDIYSPKGFIHTPMTRRTGQS